MSSLNLKLDSLRQWAQSQIDNSARPAVRPDIGVAVLELLDIIEELDQPASPLLPVAPAAEGQPSC